jgi:hypothetical protein
VAAVPSGGFLAPRVRQAAGQPPGSRQQADRRLPAAQATTRQPSLSVNLPAANPALGMGRGAPWRRHRLPPARSSGASFVAFFLIPGPIRPSFVPSAALRAAAALRRARPLPCSHPF